MMNKKCCYCGKTKNSDNPDGKISIIIIHNESKHLAVAKSIEKNLIVC